MIRRTGGPATVQQQSSRNVRRDALLACFALSGAAGLIYEVCWIRRSTLVFGGTAPAFSTVLAVFFGGLALGAWLGGRLAQRTARPIWWYGALEIALGGLALAATWALGAGHDLYGTVYRALREQPALLTVVRALLIALPLLPPTVIMGATLPLFCRRFVTSGGKLGGSVGDLYALNTLGAAAGAAAAGFWLVPAIGIWGSVAVAAAFNIVAGTAALALVRGMPAEASTPTAVAYPDGTRPVDAAGRRLDVRLVSLLFALTGFTGLAAEVLWTRFLALLVPNSIHTYTITLTVTLLGIVLGSWLASRVADRASRLALAFGILLAAGTISVLILMHLPPRWWQGLGGGATTFLLLLLPPTMCSGACLPIAVRLALQDPTRAAAGVGRLLALNTAGAIVGSLVAGFVLLPRGGLSTSVMVVSGLGACGGAAALIGLRADGGSRRAALAVAAGLVAVWLAAVLVLPTRLPDDFIAPPAQLVAVAEGQSATLAAVRRHDDVALQIDLLWQGRREKNHQIVAAHVPMLLHPRPQRVCVVGVGVGQTASRFLLHDVTRVDCVDIEPAIFPFIAAHFGAGWLQDPRVRAIADDGRSFVAHGRDQYDVISIEVGQTFRPGVEAFYTREFYAAARQRLAPGGLLAQFVPLTFLDEASLRRVVATFLDAFPDAVLWYNTAELLLIGGDAVRIEPARLALVETDPTLRADLAYSHWGGDDVALDHLGPLLGGFLAGPPALGALAAGAKPLTDDHPVLAYATAGAREEQMREVPLAAVIARHLEPVTTHLTQPVASGVLQAAAAVQKLNVADIASAALRRQGEDRRAQGDLAGAVTTLTQALARNPQSVDVMRVLGDVYLAGGQLEPAVRLLEEATARRAGDHLARRALGIALVRANRLPEAEAQLARVAAAMPDDATTWNTLGAAQAGQGKLDAAVGSFQRAVTLAPQDASARQNLQRAMAASRRTGAGAAAP